MAALPSLPAVAEFLRFCLVGLSGYAVNLAVFGSLTAAAVDHRPAAIVAFCVAVTNNLYWNRRWTFKTPGSVTRFLVVSLAGFTTAFGVLDALVTAGLAPFPAQAASILAVTPLTFLANRTWAFRA
jgi:putative flippase GtrA